MNELKIIIPDPEYNILTLTSKKFVNWEVTKN
jgi:hypothetical protein